MSYDSFVEFCSYNQLLEQLLENGGECSPRGNKIKEILGQTIVGPMRLNVLDHPVRDLNYRFMVAEWCWIMAGRRDLATLVRFNKKYADYSDDGETLAGAYGPRIRSQLDWVLAKLREDRDTRQAVINLWTPSPSASKDIPCTLNMQFFVRGKFLNMITNMRSSDAWLGLPYDWFSFTMLGNCIAGELGVMPGYLHLNLGSIHLYEEHWELAEQLIEDEDQLDIIQSPELPYLPEPTLFNELLQELPGSLIRDKKWRTYQDVLRSPSKARAKEVLRAAVNT